jgi:hypothetical protein
MVKLQPAKPNPYEDRLLTFVALGKRWDCHPKVAYQRVHSLKVPIVKFNTRAHAVRLSDILRVEEEASA